MMAEKAPAVVLELAKKAGGTPIAWNVKPHEIVIVFEDGRKLTFDQLPARASADEEPAPSAQVEKKKKQEK